MILWTQDRLTGPLRTVLRIIILTWWACPGRRCRSCPRHQCVQEPCTLTEWPPRECPHSPSWYGRHWTWCLCHHLTSPGRARCCCGARQVGTDCSLSQERERQNNNMSVLWCGEMWDVTRLEIPLWLASLVLLMAWGGQPPALELAMPGMQTPLAAPWSSSPPPPPPPPAPPAGWVWTPPSPGQPTHGLVSSPSFICAGSLESQWSGVWSWELSVPAARCRESLGLSIPACLHSSQPSPDSPPPGHHQPHLQPGHHIEQHPVQHLHYQHYRANKTSFSCPCFCLDILHYNSPLSRPRVATL